MRLRVTLRTRVAATVALAVLGSTVAITVAAYLIERDASEDRFIAAARAGATSDLQQAQRTVDTEAQLRPVDSVIDFVAQRSGIRWVVMDHSLADGWTGAGASPAEVPWPVGGTGRDGAIDFAWTAVGTARMLALGAALPSGPTVVEFYDFSPVAQQLSRLRTDLIRLDALGLLLALALGAAVAARISRPVRLAAAAAQRLGGGELDTRIPVHGTDELAELAVSFNEMAQRLSDAMRALHEAQAQQRRFVADVSHELRTPLAAMLAAGHGLDSADPAISGRSGELLGEQTRRMSSLVANLLEISRFDAGQADLDVEEVDVEALARDVVHTVAPDHDIAITTLGDPRVPADARRLHTIMRNLVGNAVQHGAPPVIVTIDGRGRAMVVSVRDAGPGVDPAIATTAFDRFVRADTSRATNSGSTGLGLAIALENAQLHGGTLGLIPGSAPTFLLTLPRPATRQ